ncbi:MAG: hypothetical protein DI637_07035 [Citromicrobium sp.]|nr:MAG: hypothetical protein DI637_07035 [Citromicrobium sp.]
MEHTGMVANYGSFLERNEKQLSDTNKAVLAEFRDRYGSEFRNEQDHYMTKVYNYYALPPAMDNFCDVSFAVSQEALLVAPGDLASFAARTLPRIESVFEDFFRAFEQYRTDLAAWNAQYGPPGSATTMVATYSGNTSQALPTPSYQPTTSPTTVPPSSAVASTVQQTTPAPSAVPAEPRIVLPATSSPTNTTGVAAATSSASPPVVISGEDTRNVATPTPTVNDEAVVFVAGTNPDAVGQTSDSGVVFQSGEIVQQQEPSADDAEEPDAQ